MQIDGDRYDLGPRPRVLADREAFDRASRLREADERAATWFDALRRRGDEILDEPPVEYEIPDGLRLLRTSREAHERVRDLGALYKLTGETRYAERGWEELEAVAAFPDWNTRHFLDTAEMATAVGNGYDWLHDYLDADQRATLRDAVFEMAFEPALAGYRGNDDTGGDGDKPHTWFLDVTHNWNTVCNGGLTVAALALAGDGDREDLLAEVVESARDSIAQGVDAIGPNGGWDEGVNYWGYNTRYLVYYLASVENALGTSFGLAERPSVARVGQFPIHLTGPGGMFTYGDGEPFARIESPALSWLASRFDRPEYAGYQLESVGDDGGVMDLLWYDPDAATDYRTAGLDLDARFPGAEDAVTMRSGWGRDATFLGFKAGDNTVNHGDLDLGNFVFDAAGIRWALDLPKNDYNVPGYWEYGPEGRRWNYYRRRAEGHNLVVVDPDDGPDQDPLATAEVDAFDADRDSAHAVADLSDAYPGASVERGVGLAAGRERVLVRDEIRTDEPTDVWWFWHTDADVTVDGTSATLSKNGQRLRVRVAEPTDAAFEVRDAAPLPSSPAPAAEEPVEGVQKLALHFEAVEELSVTVRAAIEDGSTEALDRTAPPLADW